MGLYPVMMCVFMPCLPVSSAHHHLPEFMGSTPFLSSLWLAEVDVRYAVPPNTLLSLDVVCSLVAQ
jgi:hypothetical protein